MKNSRTPSQTIGPFFKIGLEGLYQGNLVNPELGMESISIEGQVSDGEGAPVTDALIELWQANRFGKYDHPDDMGDKPLETGLSGYGRVPTDNDGRFRFTTVKPGPVPYSNDEIQAPHIVVTVFMRGLLRELITRIYFPDERLNVDDPVLNLVDVGRRDTLIAKAHLSKPRTLEWNIILQGKNETVFFDI